MNVLSGPHSLLPHSRLSPNFPCKRFVSRHLDNDWVATWEAAGGGAGWESGVDLFEK